MNKRMIFTTAVILSVLFLLVYRIIHSVDVSDEAYGIAEIYNASLGNIPIVDIWDPHTGWFLYVPILKLFKLLSNDLEGIILFFRCAYLFFAVVVMGVVYYILQKNTVPNNHYLLLLVCISSICYVPFSVPQIGYNAGVSFLLILVFALVYSSEKRVNLLSAGVLMGITCLLYPTMAVLTVLFSLFLRYIAHKKLRLLTFYFIGVGVVGVLFVIWITSTGGLEEVIDGMKAMATTPHEANKGSVDFVFLKNTYYDRLSLFFTLPQMIVWGAYLCIWIIAMIVKQNNIYTEIPIHVAFLVQQYLYIHFNNAILPISQGGYMLFTVFLVSIVLLIRHRCVLNMRFFLGIVLLVGWITTYCFTSDNKNLFFGFDAAGPLVIFMGAFIATYLWNANIIDDTASAWKSISGLLIPLLLIVFSISSFFGYVYRDEPFSNLNSRVDAGIYKGLYTTEEKKNYLENLELDIKNTIDRNTRVCMVNNMPALYLMSEADICAPQTWDAQFLANGYTSAQPLISYFEHKKKMPDIMIANNYIDNEIFQRTDAEIWDYLEQYYDYYDTHIEGGYVTKIWKKRTLEP